MDTAEVGVSARLAERVRIFVVRIERFGLKHAVAAGNCVWKIILIDPGNRAVHRDSERIRAKSEVVHAHF